MCLTIPNSDQLILQQSGSQIDMILLNPTMKAGPFPLPAYKELAL